MDASLNDELDRYRHWQENGQTISYLNPFRPRAVSTQSIWTSPSLSDALSPLTPIDPNEHDQRTIQMPVMPNLGTVSSPSINISAAELHRYKGLDLNDNLGGFDSSNNVVSNEPLAYAQNLSSFEGDATQLDSPPMAKIPEPDDDDILQSFANDYADHYADRDQDSVDQNYQSPYPQEKSALRSLMNPVGIISLLLLLCSSAAIGYLMVDPSGVMKLFKPESRPKAAQTDGKTDGKNTDLGSDINLQNQQRANDTGLSFVPFAGDKTQSNQAINGLTKSNKPLTDSAAKNTLTNSTKSSALFAPSTTFVPSPPLRTVPSSSFPTTSVAPLPPVLAPIERSYNPPASSPRRTYTEPPAATSSEPTQRSSSSSPRATSSTAAPVSRATSPAVVPTTVYVAPRSNTAVKYAAPLSSAPAPVATTPNNNSSYRVVVENSYASNARQIERDAYVRPSDGQVQVGSYRDPNAAQQRIEQLRRQGIPARIE